MTIGDISLYFLQKLGTPAINIMRVSEDVAQNSVKTRSGKGSQGIDPQNHRGCQLEMENESPFFIILVSPVVMHAEAASDIEAYRA